MRYHDQLMLSSMMLDSARYATLVVAGGRRSTVRAELDPRRFRSLVSPMLAHILKGVSTLSASEEPREDRGEAAHEESGASARADTREAAIDGPLADPREDPAVAQRRLRTGLRALRLRPERRETQKTVASALDWSPSKLLRIEQGQVPLATSDLIALLTHYGITDEKEVSDWVELARVSRRTTIWDTYGDVFSKLFAEFVQHEWYASVIRQYETKLVPGVLQTEDYAEAVVRAYLGPRPDERIISRTVQARLERADHLLNQTKNRPEMFFILDEAVVRRRVGRESGNNNVMIRQLEYLKEVSSRANIQIQIVPFDLGIYTALRGPFELLEFEDPDNNMLLYRETPQGDQLLYENNDEIGPYLDIFTELEERLKKNVRVSFIEQTDAIIAQLKLNSSAGQQGT